MGGGGGDGDGERACLDDFGLLAPVEVGGEPSCFGFGSGLFVSPGEASAESLSVAADFGLEGAGRKVVRGRGGHCWRRGGIYHFGLEKGSRALEECRASCFLPLRSTSVAFNGERNVGGGRGGGRRGGEKSGPIRKVQTILAHCHFIFFSSPTLSKPSVLKYFVPSSRSVDPIRSAFPIVPRTLPSTKAA